MNIFHFQIAKMIAVENFLSAHFFKIFIGLTKKSSQPRE